MRYWQQKNIERNYTTPLASLFAGIIISFFFFLNSWAYSAEYPQVDVSGYKKYEYSNLTVDKIQSTFQAQSLLGAYYSGGPWQERLRLRIVGKLTEKLSVSYDLEQEPEMPDKFDVKVTYDKTELTFGDFQANFGGNEFVSTSKYLNGVMITSRDNWYDLTFVPSSKLKSETQHLVTQKGNNSRGPYNLGHGSIIEDSERIELNNGLLRRGDDYSIDYFSGKITFSRILSPDDEFKYSYEFTNALDMFFPTVSKRDFVGLRSSVTIDPALLGAPSRKIEKSIKRRSEVFPTTITIITKEVVTSTAETATSETNGKERNESEWESSGIYRLKNSPVIPYSEKINYKGSQLKKFEDYLINYQDGIVTLLSPNLPTYTEPMQVEYEYVEVSATSETIAGSGKGPYALKYQNVTEGSESIYVNNIPYIRGLDYTIDYEQGKIMFFSNIPQTAMIVAKYRFLVMTKPPSSPAQTVPRSLNLGVSYLKESGKRGGTSPSSAVTETKSGQKIIDNDMMVYLMKNPVTGINDVEVRRNDIVLTYGVDYVFPTIEVLPDKKVKVIPQTKLQHVCDPYDESDGLKTGTIKFIGDILGTDEVTISYDYYKWSSGRFTESGTSQLNYPLTGFRNLVPGSESLDTGLDTIGKIKIWRKSDPTDIQIITRVSSIDAKDGSYFMDYSDHPASITFIENPLKIGGKEYRLEDINFSFMVRFVAVASVSDKPISHDIIGVDSTFKVGDYLNLEGSVAKSKTDQVYSSVSTNETRYGDGKTRTFNLNSPAEIIEGSEQVTLGTQKLNRDDQYQFIYTSNSSGKYGILTFYMVVPTSTDVISVDYSYQDFSGVAVDIKEKEGVAYKLGGTIKPNSNIEFSADYKKIDSDFSPMGGTPIPVGSDYSHAYTKMTPFPSFWSSLWFSSDIKESNVPLSNKELFLRSSDRNLAGGFNPQGLAQVDFGFREFNTLDDILPGSTIHNSDYKSQAYSLSVAPRPVNIGEFGYTNRMDGRKTLSYTDTEDKILPKDSITDFYHMNNSFDFTRRVRWILDYQVNQPSIISYESGSRKKPKLVDQKEIDDLSSYLNWDLTFGSIKRLYTYWNKLGHNEHDFILDVTKSTINETYHADFVPINQTVLGADYNRQETPTITTAFGNPKSERYLANAKITPYSSTAFGWSGSKDDSLFENGTKTRGNSNMYSVDHIPVSASNYKLTTRYSLATNLRAAPEGTKEVNSDTRTFSQDYNLSYSPITIWTLSSGFLQEDYLNKNNSKTSPVDIKSQSQTTKVGTSYKATNDLDLSGNYSVKVTSLANLNLSAHKSLLDAHAIYRVFIYGTLNYDWSQEENGGEVIGSSFLSQDLVKIIQAVSLNVVVPQNEQMVLSSVVVKVAYKWANYEDRNNPANNFKAYLLTFEGTLNF